MKHLFIVYIFVLFGSSSLVLAASPDIQAELNKSLAFARAGDYAAARAICRGQMRRRGSDPQSGPRARPLQRPLQRHTRPTEIRESKCLR